MDAMMEPLDVKVVLLDIGKPLYPPISKGTTDCCIALAFLPGDTERVDVTWDRADLLMLQRGLSVRSLS
jgi:hypothetical protein